MNDGCAYARLAKAAPRFSKLASRLRSGNAEQMPNANVSFQQRSAVRGEDAAGGIEMLQDLEVVGFVHGDRGLKPYCVGRIRRCGTWGATTERQPRARCSENVRRNYRRAHVHSLIQCQVNPDMHRVVRVGEKAERDA
jgi:hypothetical protein